MLQIVISGAVFAVLCYLAYRFTLWLDSLFPRPTSALRHMAVLRRSCETESEYLDAVWDMRDAT